MTLVWFGSRSGVRSVNLREAITTADSPTEVDGIVASQVGRSPWGQEYNKYKIKPGKREKEVEKRQKHMKPGRWQARATF